MHAVEHQPARGANFPNQNGHLIRIHGFRDASQEPELRSRIRAVSLARGSEAPHQLDLERCCLLEHASIAKQFDECIPGAHRPHRMRRRRPDAHLEHVENTDCHFLS